VKLRRKRLATSSIPGLRTAKSRNSEIGTGDSRLGSGQGAGVMGRAGAPTGTGIPQPAS
jgi:hypothetical protein